MLSLRTLLLATVLSVAALLPATAWADVTAEAVNVEVTAAADTVDATFKVAVSSETALSNVWVVFEDGAQLQVGDVAAGGTATSEAVTRTLQPATRNQPVPVTLKYTVNGEQAEASATLIVRLR